MTTANRKTTPYRVTGADRAVVLVAVILVGSLYFLNWSREDAQWVEIQVDHATPSRYAAHIDRMLTVEGAIGPSVIEIQDGAARFVDSPCTTKLCVRGGWHRHDGEVGACLPNRISLAMVGGEREWDAINY